MNKQTIFFDCDDTLVMWPPYQGPDAELLHIADPYNPNKPPIGVYPHKRHISYLKKSQQFNKATIVVWSAGGEPWARNVVEALGLEKYVTHILSKPDIYVDDLKANEFMGLRYYLDYEGAQDASSED